MTIRSLQHIALTVPDAVAGKQFYTDFGMQAKDDSAGKQVVMRCHGRDQDQIILIEGAKKRLHHICLGARADAIKEITQRLEKTATSWWMPRANRRQRASGFTIPMACW